MSGARVTRFGGRRYIVAGFDGTIDPDDIGPGGGSTPDSDTLDLDGATVDIDTGAGYKAFPDVCVMPNGNLLMVYRHGTDHATTQDGIIKGRTSSDGGLTWGAAFTIYSPGGGLDARGVSVATLSDGRIVVSAFTWNGASTRVCKVIFSSDNAATWGAAITVSHTFTTAATGGRVVEITPDLLLQPIYGNSGGDWDSAVVKSTDGGATWGSQVTIATGSSHDWQEPCIVRLANGDLFCMIRVEDILEIHGTTSTDDGATWSTPVPLFDGRSLPAVTQLASGALLLGYRYTDLIYYRTSWDNGATWEDAVALTPTGTQMEYAGVAQMASGRVVMVWSYQTSSTDADLVLQAFTDYTSETLVQDLSVRGKVGFHNAEPIEQPTIEGEWGDGTAGMSLADALNDLGLVHDKTTAGTSSGGTPATTVESETTFGITPAVGTDTEYARQDHTHGSPSSATLEAAGHYEVLMDGASPPAPLEDGSGTDWLYVWVP